MAINLVNFHVVCFQLFHFLIFISIIHQSIYMNTNYQLLQMKLTSLKYAGGFTFSPNYGYPVF